MCEDRSIAFKGQKFTILWAATGNGRFPALEFFETLEVRNQAKILALFEMLAAMGSISNEQKFKKLQDGIWEFKSYQLRFLGSFRPDGVFVVATGLKKKRDKHKTKDLGRARRILEEHDELQNS